MTAPKDEELAFAGVARLGELLRAGEVTPRELGGVTSPGSTG
jgi:hypothetical protein